MNGILMKYHSQASELLRLLNISLQTPQTHTLSRENKSGTKRFRLKSMRNWQLEGLQTAADALLKMIGYIFPQLRAEDM